MFHDGRHVLEPPNIMNGGAEVQSFQNISQGIEPNHFSRAFRHDGTEGLEAGEGAMPLQSDENDVKTPLFVVTTSRPT